MASVLPPEVIDLIIDFLHDDKPSLAACTLISKDFLPSTRFHLFSEVPVQPRHMLPLLELLASPSNQIAPFVQRLLFDNLGKLLFYNGITEVERCIRLLPLLTSRLPHVKSLRFSNFDLEHIPEDIRRNLFSSFPDFKDLDLYSLHFYRFSEFLDLVCAFPFLEKISLKWVTWTYNGHHLAPITPRGSPLIRWNLSRYSGQSLIDLGGWLLDQDPPPLLQSLHYGASSAHENNCIRQLLRHSGGSLEHLYISFPISLDFNALRDILKDFIDLTECKNLRSLHFKQILLWPASRDDVTSAIRTCIYKLLSQLTSQHIRELSFEFIIDPTPVQSECSFDEFNWGGIVELLCRAPFDQLESIQVLMNGGGGDEVEAMMSIREGKLVGFRDILRIN